MNLVKQSLLPLHRRAAAMIGLLGAQSRRQVSRLSAATDGVVAGGTLATAPETCGFRFLGAEQDLFQQATAFVDTESAADTSQGFRQRVGELREADSRGGAEAGADTGASPPRSPRRSRPGLSARRPRLSAEGVTELPAHDRSTAPARGSSGEIDALVERAAEAPRRRSRQPQRRGAPRCGRWRTRASRRARPRPRPRRARSLHRQLGGEPTRRRGGAGRRRRRPERRRSPASRRPPSS